MMRFNDEIKAFDFSIDDIDNIINALIMARDIIKRDGCLDITDIDNKSGIIIQASDEENIWIEPVENCGMIAE